MRIIICAICILRIWPGWPILLLPAFTVLAIAMSLGFGIWLAAINVRYRDVGYILPFLIQLSLYLSPVAYSVHLVPGGIARTLYALNPLVGLIEGFRWCLLGGPPPDYSLALSVGIVVLLVVTGMYYFRRTEKTFADVM